jgi:selenocysteine-specific elongation factor
MSSVILGTAGHIDHGKTALVRALTGVDTDRLKEEKERGITIELGFAELAAEGRPHFGVVDVPGHEAFVRAMVAGAGGMDVVLLVVAADEGVMPQTREHLAIVELLAVPELVVALTKCDAVEAEWLELVEADVADTLSGTPYSDAPMVRTSAVAGTGLDELLDALAEAAKRVHSEARADLTRLPLDRVFTIQGTGTVVTGTLWGGNVSVGDRVRILPDDVAARVRTVQVHGRRVEAAEARDRTAVALAGEGADRDVVSRGATLLADSAWEASWMLTARVRLLEYPGWSLEHNQRLHVHLGTAEVLARGALLESSKLGPGESGWIQLRLEEPLVARAGDRFVVRAYSPVTTIGGGIVAEVQPPKRKRLDADVRGSLARILDGGAEEAIAAYLDLVGWAGADLGALSIHTGLAPAHVTATLPDVEASGALRTGRRAFASSIREKAEQRVLERADREHARDTLSEAVPLPPLRAALPSWAPSELAQAVIDKLVAEGHLEWVEGGVRRPGHRAELTGDQVAASQALERVFAESGLAPPSIDELPDELRTRPDVRSLLRRLESLGVVRQVADGLYVDSAELERARQRVRERLGGRRDLGPADFREALPVTRKHLIPLLNYLDGEGTTRRGDGGREVPAAE